ncbi:PilZ domain-containing protein [Novosphingobium lentum]|uniref:PilZ domain-containing protein n=1 Tax=Novosphingobium lentum TaxID=145287 RepID=UPI0008356BD2|nr:PilZ domain-containing protein [Novosphingobium lentum]
MTGRRSQSRLRLCLHAKLITVFRTWDAILADLSAGGAMIALPNEAKCGQDAILTWHGNEAFGRIVWVDGRLCGVSFFDPLPRSVILDSRRLDEANHARNDMEQRRQFARTWVTGGSRTGMTE